MASDEVTKALGDATLGLTKIVENLFKSLRQSHSYIDAHIAIVGASIMDEHLERVFLAKMRSDMSNELRGRVFESGALSNFAAKIDVAFALQFIDADLHRDLRALNKIRVALAHTTKIRTFNDAEIQTLFDAFTSVDKSMATYRERLLAKLQEMNKRLETIAPAP